MNSLRSLLKIGFEPEEALCLLTHDQIWKGHYGQEEPGERPKWLTHDFIFDENCEVIAREFFSSYILYSRGWSDEVIRKFLGQPAKIETRIWWGIQTDRPVWLASRVRGVEKTEDWLAWRGRVKSLKKPDVITSLMDQGLSPPEIVDKYPQDVLRAQKDLPNDFAKSRRRIFAKDYFCVKTLRYRGWTLGAIRKYLGVEDRTTPNAWRKQESTRRDTRQYRTDRVRAAEATNEWQDWHQQSLGSRAKLADAARKYWDGKKEEQTRVNEELARTGKEISLHLREIVSLVFVAKYIDNDVPLEPGWLLMMLDTTQGEYLRRVGNGKLVKAIVLASEGKYERIGRMGTEWVDELLNRLDRRCGRIFALVDAGIPYEDTKPLIKYHNFTSALALAKVGFNAAEIISIVTPAAA